MSKPRKKYNPRKHQPASFGTIKLAIGKAMTTPTDDLDILTEPDADYLALLAGNATIEGFTRLCEMATALFCAGRLLKERGVGDTGLIGWGYEETGNEAAEALQAIAQRYKASGRLVGTGDEYRRVKECLTALRTVIPALTRGELITVLNEAAGIVEDAGKRQRKAGQAAAQQKGVYGNQDRKTHGS